MTTKVTIETGTKSMILRLSYTAHDAGDGTYNSFVSGHTEYTIPPDTVREFQVTANQRLELYEAFEFVAETQAQSTLSAEGV